MKIKKGHTVLVIAGKDRGKKRKILRILPKKGKVVVEGVNIVKKHQKPKKEGEKGQIVELPAPIDASNVKVICAQCNKAVRIGYRLVADRKIAICKKCGKEI